MIDKYSKELFARSLQGLIQVLQEYLYLPDIENHLRVIVATVLANRVEGDPVWLLVMDEPSSGKTELLNLLYGQQNCHFISTITANTLASGYKGEVSLLTTLDPEPTPIMIVKDFNTIATLQQDKRNEILSQLREVFDGKFNKRFGNGVQVNWQGKLGFIGACTPVIQRYLSVWGILGERFIIYRLGSKIDQVQASLKAINISGEEQLYRDSAREILENILKGISTDIPVLLLKPDDDAGTRIANLSAFVVKARSPVMRNSYTREVEYVGSESSPRLAKSLVQLSKGFSLLRGNDRIGLKDYELLTDVAFSSVPPDRLKLLFLLNEAHKPLNFSTIQSEGKFHISESGLRRLIEDLSLLGLVQINGKGITQSYEVSPYAIELINGFQWNEPEHSDNQTETKKDRSFDTGHIYTPLNSETTGKVVEK